MRPAAETTVRNKLALYGRLREAQCSKIYVMPGSGQTQCSMKRSWHQDGTCLRKTVRNKMALSGRSHQVQVRRCASWLRPHRYQHCTLTLFVGPTIRVEWLAPLHFPQKDWHRQVWFQHFGSKTADDMRKASYLFKIKTRLTSTESGIKLVQG